MSDENKNSFFDDANEDDDLQPHQLSGDESAERSVLVSDIASTKASTHPHIQTSCSALPPS